MKSAKSALTHLAVYREVDADGNETVTTTPGVDVYENVPQVYPEIIQCCLTPDCGPEPQPFYDPEPIVVEDMWALTQRIVDIVIPILDRDGDGHVEKSEMTERGWNHQKEQMRKFFNTTLPGMEWTTWKEVQISSVGVACYHHCDENMKCFDVCDEEYLERWEFSLPLMSYIWDNLGKVIVERKWNEIHRAELRWLDPHYPVVDPWTGWYIPADLRFDKNGNAVKVHFTWEGHQLKERHELVLLHTPTVVYTFYDDNGVQMDDYTSTTYVTHDYYVEAVPNYNLTVSEEENTML